MTLTGERSSNLINLVEDVRKELREISYKPRDGRMFALVVGIGLLFVGWRFDWMTTEYLLGVLVVFMGGIMVPDRLSGVYKTWMGIGLTLGWIVNRILLTIVFLTVISPLAMLRRARGKAALDLAFDEDADTFWKDTDTKEDTTTYLKQF